MVKKSASYLSPFENNGGSNFRIFVNFTSVITQVVKKADVVGGAKILTYPHSVIHRWKENFKAS